MGTKYCMPRNVLLVFLVLQLISTVERQIFDFLGYMWIPILGNFFNLVFVIFGLFGLYQYRSNYMLAYTIWTLFWLGFNTFIVCYYLNVGDLHSDDDILSFGTGSFSWWLVNSPGCQPHYNTTVVPENANHPLRPSSVEGCYMTFQDIEVTHAAIQIVIAGVGLVMAVYMTHYYITVINPKREKQGVKAMYSIEYSPSHRDTSNPNTLERETDLAAMEQGDGGRPQAAAMTPRRVKRRSYRNSTRSHKEKSMSRKENHNRLSLPKSARTSARSHKSINPVTRLIDADQNRADSSTSNEAERYGQINPGFQGDQSRPNSIYNLSGPPTDSRPQSALTSYSNFHPAQRRGPGGGAATGPASLGPLPRGVTSLTQESLMNHQHTMNSSFDDLPPPPPPISSSPSPQDDQVSESDNCSSVATAQIPVPLQRSSIRRNEYVNIPIPPRDSSRSPVPAIISHQEPEPQVPGPKNGPPPPGPMGPPPVPPHNYANLPSHTGARPRPSNPLYGKKEDLPSYTEVGTRDPLYGPRGSYEAETLRADAKLSMPPPYQQYPRGEPYSLEPQYGQRQPGPPSPRGSVSSNGQSDRYAQIQDYQGGGGQDQGRFYQPDHKATTGHHNGFPEAAAGREGDSGVHSMEPPPPHHALEAPPEPAPLKRVPNGHSARDRASLRLRQRKEMEQKAAIGRAAKLSNGGGAPTYVNSGQAGQLRAPGGGGEDEYGFSAGPPGAASTGRPAGPNGYADMSGKVGQEVDDKWYLKDSMRPVGASNHGLNCKCYRCQRKLTAI